MEIKEEKINASGIKFYIETEGKVIGRAYLYILRNDLHNKPLAFLEDVFIDESYRGRGIGSELIKKVIQASKREGCYKLICTSRYEREKVHEFYEKLGFRKHGYEFRIDFDDDKN